VLDISDRMAVGVLGGEWKGLIFCSLEVSVVAAKDSERRLEMERCDYREQLTSFWSGFMSFVFELYI